MNRFYRVLSSLGIILVLLGITSCSATRPTAEWRDEKYSGAAFNNILIIGISEKAIVRRMFEDTFVAELRKRNVEAVSSARLMSIEEKISRESVESAIEGKNINAVLVTHLVGVEQKQVYHAPVYRPVTARPYAGYYNYYSRVYDDVYTPGYYEKFDIVKLETNLYDKNTSEVVWSMQSETIDSNAESEVIKSVIKAVIEALAKQKLI